MIYGPLNDNGIGEQDTALSFLPFTMSRTQSSGESRKIEVVGILLQNARNVYLLNAYCS